MMLSQFSTPRLLPALAAAALALAVGSCTQNPPGPTIVETAPVTPEPLNAVIKSYDSYRTLVWNDEFDGAALNPQKWAPEIRDVWYNNELQATTNSRNNLGVTNGNLVITAQREAYNGRAYTSARINTKRLRDFTFGRIDVRAKLPKGKGIWPAIWMLPDQNPYGNKSWPDNGEIDIMEHVGYDPNVIHATTHCKAYYFRLNTQKTGITKLPDATTAFHVYSMEWTPETITAQIDGQLYFAHRNENTGWETWPWDQPFHLLLNIAVGGEWGGSKGIDEAIFPQQMLVDYVRFYQMSKS